VDYKVIKETKRKKELQFQNKEEQTCGEEN
jgi:hypothetical protein